MKFFKNQFVQQRQMRGPPNPPFYDPLVLSETPCQYCWFCWRPLVSTVGDPPHPLTPTSHNFHRPLHSNPPKSINQSKLFTCTPPRPPHRPAQSFAGKQKTLLGVTFRDSDKTLHCLAQSQYIPEIYQQWMPNISPVCVFPPCRTISLGTLRLAKRSRWGGGRSSMSPHQCRLPSLPSFGRKTRHR